MMISVEQLHRALGGKICRAKDGTQQVLCPGPTDTGKYTSLSVKPADGDPGFIICSFDTGDTFEQCVDYVRSRLGSRDYTSVSDICRRALASDLRVRGLLGETEGEVIA